MMKPIIFVAGLGRCGTSLAMQMLDATGIPCAGNYPAFEPAEMAVFGGTVDTKWLQQHAGGAVKWIDPHRVHVDTSALNGVVLWLYREKRQQAKSQAKMLNHLEGIPLNRAKVRRMVKALREDTAPALLAASKFKGCSIRFEDLIGRPTFAAMMMISFLEQAGFPFSHDATEKMASQVVERRAECLPDLDLETQLLRAGAST